VDYRATAIDLQHVAVRVDYKRARPRVEQRSIGCPAEIQGAESNARPAKAFIRANPKDSKAHRDEQAPSGLEPKGSQSRVPGSNLSGARFYAAPSCAGDLVARPCANDGGGPKGFEPVSTSPRAFCQRIKDLRRVSQRVSGGTENPATFCSERTKRCEVTYSYASIGERR